MLLHTTVPLSRAWNSWSDRPAEMVFLPLGVRVTPILYSSKSRTTSEIAPRRDPVRLGRHSIDGSHIDLETDHSGTTIGFSATKSDPFTVCGRWETLKTGEWGLRFWVTLAISAEGGEIVTFDEDKRVTLVKVGTRFVAVATADAPVQVTGHDTIAALRADFEANGYFHLATRSDAAPVLALRFNLEMMRQGSYCAAVADSAALATANAIAGLAAKRPADLEPAHTAAYEGALDAMRDVVAWNTVWDETNARPYTAVTRIWNLGKFAVWYNDQTFAALLAGVFDADLARENMAVALAGATPQGNIACIVTSNDAWVDRSQPPHGALVTWQLYQRSGESSIIRASYDALARNNRWWRTHRDPDSTGLVSCGTSDVGEGLYKGTAFAARNETGMDNSATHDEAVYQPETRSLSTFDLGLNCALALDAEMLARMASVLGHHEDAAEFAPAADRIRKLISQELWDDKRKIFANRQRKDGFVRSLSPTSFYPLLCGAATVDQAEHLLRHLNDENTFAGTFGLPNATRDDPAFGDNVYWRGRIWPNVNFMVWLGLRRYGYFKEASSLARQSYDLFMKSWRTDRIAAENYNAVTGEAMDQGDTDPFYIWSALLPLMAVGEICDFDPWRGWTITNSGEDVFIGPMLTPAGTATVAINNGLLVLSLNGNDFLRTSIRGQFSEIAVNNSSVSFSVLPTEAGGGTIELPSFPASTLSAGRVGETDLTVDLDQTGCIRVELPPEIESRRVSLHFSNNSRDCRGTTLLTF